MHIPGSFHISTPHSIFPYTIYIHRGGPVSKNLVDLAVLVLRYPAADDVVATKNSIPLPVSCAIASGSHIQNIITCSGFLDAGKYAILPLSFCNWRPHSVKFTSPGSNRSRRSTKTSQLDEGSTPYTVALFSARELYYDEHVLTRPGFLAESLFLLAEKHGTKSEVSLHPQPLSCDHSVSADVIKVTVESLLLVSLTSSLQ